MVEDEPVLAEALRVLFARHHYTADTFSTARRAFDAAVTGAYDCLIVDVRLPDANGIHLVADLREAGITTPILVLTVQNDPSDRVHGLNAGADDYLGKLFDADELLARVRALVRRTTAPVAVANRYSRSEDRYDPQHVFQHTPPSLSKLK